MNRLKTVGAPRVFPYDPLPGTASARFHDWVRVRRSRIRQLLDRLTDRFSLLGSFVEINFMHPEFGPSGALVLAVPGFDVSPLQRRVDRLMVIPLREMAEYLPQWWLGETVVASVEQMPSELARRYANTPIEWSLNVPLQVEGQWIGTLGGVAAVNGFDQTSIGAFEAGAEVLMLEYSADTTLWQFRRAAESGNRFLRLLP